MDMNQKNNQVKKYIINLSNNMNSQYSNIMPKDKIDKAIEMFSNSESNLEEIIENINKMAQQVVNNYLKLLKQKQELANQKVKQNIDERNSKTFEQIKSTQERVQQLLEATGLKIYISGGSVPYLLLNQNSNRLHDDIDTVCKLEDMQKLRELFKNEGLYNQEWDSMTYAKDGKDYGFEMIIDGVPFGIYPFNYENGQLTQYSYDPYNKQCKIKTLPLQELSDYIMTYRGLDGKMYDTMSLEFIKMTKDNAGREKDIIDSKKISETGLLRLEILNRINMFTETQKLEVGKLKSNKIELTPELIEIFNNIKRDSKFSSRELMTVYAGMPEYQELAKKIQVQTIQLEKQIKEIRQNNSQLTDEIFFKTILVNRSNTIIEAIKKDYVEILTPDIIERLNKFNINVINEPEEHGDMTAHPEIYQVSINMAHFATERKDVEGKVVRAMATMPHEIFHFIYRILKDEKNCDERIVYNLTNGDKATCFGMVGHMLNEGFVEKLSTDFCNKNNIYSSINPSYIQFTKLCDYITKVNPTVNKSFLIHNNYEGILNTFSDEAREKYKETERIEYLGNFKLKTQSGVKRIINEQEIVSSYNEKVESNLKDMSQIKTEKRENKNINSFTHASSLNKESKKYFDQRSQSEITIATQIKEKNMEIKQQKETQRALNKSKVKTLTKKTNNGSASSGGFVDTLILTLITGFIAGAIFIVVYNILK
ncbi:MAG: hypothetical protein PHG18_02065 [Bacilli bacterium]|nr:hypothetical protein [Bacilli bacterium]